jgi:hypothetical protein
MTRPVPDDHETQDQPEAGEEEISNPQKVKTKATTAAYSCRGCCRGPHERFHSFVRKGLVR